MNFNIYDIFSEEDLEYLFVLYCYWSISVKPFSNLSFDDWFFQR